MFRKVRDPMARAPDQLHLTHPVFAVLPAVHSELRAAFPRFIELPY